jgi:Ring finger domain
MFPRAYDYYRPVPAHVLRGSHSPSSSSSSSSSFGGNSSNSNSNSELVPLVDVETGGMIECVICYNVVDTSTGTYMVRVRVMRRQTSQVSSSNANANSSFLLPDLQITPCDHLFHKACLEQWLSMKMECCICRAVLPPLEES